ncbi:MAG: flavodoxin [Bacilli bacterium]|nr:flavodoxin [Bacilli bacterium]
MNIAVVYQSRGGNTKKVAEAIARALHTAAWEVEEAKNLDCDLLILGSAVYAAQLDKKTKAFIDSLNGTSAKRVALFGTSAGGRKPFGMMRKALTKKGLPVDDRDLFIPGAWTFMNKGRPNDQDLANAEAWAKSLIEG